VAFQCRNPIHRAHYELFIRALDAPNVGKSGVCLVHPTCGPTQVRGAGSSSSGARAPHRPWQLQLLPPPPLPTAEAAGGPRRGCAHTPAAAPAAAVAPAAAAPYRHGSWRLPELAAKISLPPRPPPASRPPAACRPPPTRPGPAAPGSRPQLPLPPPPSPPPPKLDCAGRRHPGRGALPHLRGAGRRGGQRAAALGVPALLDAHGGSARGHPAHDHPQELRLHPLHHRPRHGGLQEHHQRRGLLRRVRRPEHRQGERARAGHAGAAAPARSLAGRRSGEGRRGPAPCAWRWGGGGGEGGRGAAGARGVLRPMQHGQACGSTVAPPPSPAAPRPPDPTHPRPLQAPPTHPHPLLTPCRRCPPSTSPTPRRRAT
jgi:hypothetical protein